MFGRRQGPHSSGKLEEIDAVELVSLCARDPEDTGLWSEFLRRFAGRIRVFIRGTIRQSGRMAGGSAAIIPGAAEENDLVQNVILRLVDNDCAVLKRFSGATEYELIAYLAVIARSTVRDFIRRQMSQKRNVHHGRRVSLLPADRIAIASRDPESGAEAIERRVLAREIARLSMKVLRDGSSPDSARDQLVFELYFSEDLSVMQIAQCKGIGLSKSGVVKLIDRLKEQVRSAAAARSTKVVLQ